MFMLALQCLFCRDILKSINGLVLPGGNVWFYEDDNKTPRDNGYVQASEILYSEVKEVTAIGLLFDFLKHIKSI